MGRAVASIILAAFLTQPAVAAGGEEVLTNEDILVMTEGGLSERVVIAKIMASETDFDIAHEQLVALARAGVEAAVLEAMVVKSVPSAASRTPWIYAQRFEGTPCTAPGLYVEEDGGELRVIDPLAPQIRSGNQVLTSVTWGLVPVKARAAIRGARSDTRTNNRVPTFWFCPEESEYSADPRTMVDPRDFLVVALKASESRRERSVQIGSASILTGGRTGVPPRSIRRMKYEDVGFGVYQITPRSALNPGEYGFYYTGGQFAAGGPFGGGKIYAFGIDKR